jgi:GNAT superfamily N-acetyltransferase
LDCGDAALNDYIRNYAWQNQVRHQVGVTHVAIDESQQNLVIGYYTLASSRISRTVLRGDPTIGRLPYEDVPAILLGRLAVDARFRRRGVGEALLADALDRALEFRRYVGCRCVIVDAYPEAVGWYAKYGFVPISGEPSNAPTQKMFIDLRTVERAKQ